jgi:HD-GYP domain-containing protein (c-di-GMP phosphodiesterase class II)
MHDIGKIGVSDKILNKDGKLDALEYQEIKKHPEIGYRILSAVNEFSEIANFVLEHHEKWDGTGYPQGLKGDQIRIESRIIAVVDAYDAMTSKRTYGIMRSHQEAIDELTRCAGTHFDPEVVTIFLNTLV